MLQLTQIKNPFSVAVFEDKIFWSDLKTRTIQRVEKTTGKDRTVLIKRSGQPFGLKVCGDLLKYLPGPPGKRYVYELANHQVRWHPPIVIPSITRAMAVVLW